MSFGYGPTAVNEIRKHIVYILYDIICSCKNGYAIYCGFLLSDAAIKLQSGI